MRGRLHLARTNHHLHWGNQAIFQLHNLAAKISLQGLQHLVGLKRQQYEDLRPSMKCIEVFVQLLGEYEIHYRD